MIIITIIIIMRKEVKAEKPIRTTHDEQNITYSLEITNKFRSVGKGLDTRRQQLHSIVEKINEALHVVFDDEEKKKLGLL
jgi:hypothetical protein